MKSLRRFFARLAGLATRRAQDERLREEIEEHIALQTAENIRAGLSPVEARRQAMLKFGGVEASKEDCRDYYPRFPRRGVLAYQRSSLLGCMVR